jgi:ABC-type transporter Mla subunit MlaD
VSARPVARVYREHARTVDYFAAAVVGVLFAFAGWWPGPIMVMVVYFVIGHRTATRDGLQLEFADSFYYLGFTLSIASLLGSLGLFSGSGALDYDAVLQQFAAGMLTTVTGVVGRTTLQLYHRSPSERLEESTRRIEEEALRYLRSLEVTNEACAALLDRTRARTEAVAQEWVDGLSSRKTDLLRAITSLDHLSASADASASSIDARLRGVVDSLSRVSDALDTFGVRAQHSAGQLGMLDGACTATATELRALGNAAPDVSAQLRDAQPSIVTLGETVRDVAGRINNTTIEWEPLERSTAELVEKVNAICTALAQATTAVTQSAEGLRGGAEVLAGATSTLGTADLSEPLRRATTSLHRFADVIGERSDAIRRNGVAPLVEVISRARSETMALEDALNQIADVVARRLSPPTVTETFIDVAKDVGRDR